MKHKLYLLSAFAFISLSMIYAKSIKVGDISQFNEAVKTIVPGDSVVLANGTWKDAQLVFKGKGDKDKLIYLTSETFGKVTIEGLSSLRLSGEWLHVSGLVFVNGSTPGKAVIEFRTSSKNYAYNCVLTDCVIDKFNQLYKDSADHWIDIWGKKNTVEYCYFGGKANDGTTLVIWPNDSNSTNNGHLVYRNYFGPRPRLGSNGGETIRIGTSQVCTNSSGSIVDGNYFEQCNGEVEIISNKSSDNKFVNNTFFECEGSLVLRHGNRAVVSGNWFIGNGKEFTGGVRVINEGHQIYNNFFYKLRGEEFRSALAVMNAIPDSPANGYAPVKNVLIANNTYFDCVLPWSFCVGAGERNRIVTPEGLLLLNNLVFCPNESELIKSYDKTEGIKQDNNLMVSSKGVSKEYGTITGQVLNSKVWDTEMIYSTAKAKKIPFVKYDILGQLRGEAVIGAFQNKGEKVEVERATAKNCGPQWYKPVSEKILREKWRGKVTSVAAGTDNLYKAVQKANSGDVLLLEEGEHILTKKISLAKSLTIRAVTEAKVKPILKMIANKENGYLFELTGNVRLFLQGIAIDGDGKAEFPAKYAFVSSKVSALGYSLVIDDCEIFDFNVETGAIYKAYKGTMADSLKITNSVLRNSYRGFSLGEEKDNVGKYSAENISFENTVFHHFSQYIIDFYRGGIDESTLGGSFSVNHCVFDAVAMAENQIVLKLTGIVKVSVKNSIFNNSVSKTMVRLSGVKNTISSCCINDCVKPKLENGAKSENLLFVTPGFQRMSYFITDKSPLKAKASDGGNIGLR